MVNVSCGLTKINNSSLGEMADAGDLKSPPIKLGMGSSPLASTMKLSDTTLKPGTPEHNEWVKNEFIQHQITNTDTYYAAKAVADARLAKLKESYKNVPRHEDETVEQLVNEPPKSEAVNQYELKRFRFAQVNNLWQQRNWWIRYQLDTVLVPQIDNAPTWVTDETLIEILELAAKKDVIEIRQQNGHIFFAVIKRPRDWTHDDDPNNPTFSQVLVRYHLYRM